MIGGLVCAHTPKQTVPRVLPLLLRGHKEVVLDQTLVAHAKVFLHGHHDVVLGQRLHRLARSVHEIRKVALDELHKK